jgi:large subunit ribosomal protein L30
MLKAAESVLTYGEINKDTLKKLLLKRAMVSNSKKYGWDGSKLESFAEDFINGKSNLSDMKIKKVFSLHPPIKGFERKGKKTPYTLKGVFGYRGEAINQLLDRMI